MSWAENIISFYKELHPPDSIEPVQWLHPQMDDKVLSIFSQFYRKYFNDTYSRYLILGINPGRFGAGVTGVNFTAPKQLLEHCKIDHPFKNQSELSAEFIYRMILDYGGPEKFYSDYFIGSVCPLGFVLKGKNLNYYDSKELYNKIEPFIIQNLEKLLAFNVKKDVCFCIGEANNFKYLSSLNARMQWFEKIEVLPHPRFIMQYKRKKLEEYIQRYLILLKKK